MMFSDFLEINWYNFSWKYPIFLFCISNYLLILWVCICVILIFCEHWCHRKLCHKSLIFLLLGAWKERLDIKDITEDHCGVVGCRWFYFKLDCWEDRKALHLFIEFTWWLSVLLNESTLYMIISKYIFLYKNVYWVNGFDVTPQLL